MNLSIRLKSLIKERGLTQMQVAKELHLAKSTFNGYIVSGRQPDHTTLVRIADYFEVSIDYLLGATDVRVKPKEPINMKEGELVGIYRDLDADKQNMLMEQAIYYHEQKRKEKEQKRRTNA